MVKIAISYKRNLIPKAVNDFLGTIIFDGSYKDLVTYLANNLQMVLC